MYVPVYDPVKILGIVFATGAAAIAVAAEVNNNTDEHIVYTTNKGEATNLVDDVEFIVSATIVAETAAWDYEDNVTFTVVGNF